MPPRVLACGPKSYGGNKPHLFSTEQQQLLFVYLFVSLFSFFFLEKPKIAFSSLQAIFLRGTFTMPTLCTKDTF